jgi:hypothetical protein
VVGSIIKEIQVLHQKTDTIMMSLNYYLEYKKDVDGFTKFTEKEAKKEEERLKEYGQNKPTKTSDKTDNKQDTEKESVGSVSKG